MAEENVGDSVQQSDGITAGRTEQERRISGGNVRSGSGKLEREVEKMPPAWSEESENKKSPKD
jgi:hypothetical protein